MNLVIRMLYLLATFWFRKRLTSPEETSVLRYRVLPTDIDLNIHMTNGRYLSIADLGRVDLALRTGLARHVARNRWAPIVTFNAVLFRRELRLWQRFELRSRLIFWNDEIQIFEHAYHFIGGKLDGETASVVLSAASFYDRKAKTFISAEILADLLGIDPTSPPMTPRIERFISSYKAFRDAARPDLQATI
ncbi:MAG: thioesterase family protein [Pseudomonadota bacterium]